MKHRIKKHFGERFQPLLVAFFITAFLVMFGCGGGGGSSNNNPPANTPPTANAGPDQTVGAGDNVILNGTGSSDSDGSIASYSWSQVSGTAVTLVNPNSSIAGFIAPNVAAPEITPFAEYVERESRIG